MDILRFGASEEGALRNIPIDYWGIGGYPYGLLVIWVYIYTCRHNIWLADSEYLSQ